MNYKKIIKNRSTRLFLLNLLGFIPDKTMLNIQYRMKFGRNINWKNPRRFTEKIQWYKLYYRDPLMAQCSDKYEVRRYVEQTGLGETLNELYGVYDSVDDIDFNALPEKFVLKDTLGAGGNSVYICTDKSGTDVEAIKNIVNAWSKHPKKSPGREWIYNKGMPRIIIEKFIEPTDEKLGLVDYKFHCFNGKVGILQIIAERKLGVDAAFAYHTADYELLPYRASNERVLAQPIAKPQNYYEMVTVAEKLAAPFQYVRVDLYNTNEKIIFGELTFFAASGYQAFEPDEFDFILGDYFDLPERLKSVKL